LPGCRAFCGYVFGDDSDLEGSTGDSPDDCHVCDDIALTLYGPSDA
jgi:hypothetical protein